MRLKIASVLLLAGTVVGCASNPPPPPPMAAAPEPMPAPAAPPPMMAPMAGAYRGTGEVQGGSSACRQPKGRQTAQVRNDMISVAGLRGRIGPDGAITGRNLSGSVTGGTADVMVKRGRCTYHYTLTNSSGMSGSSSMPMNDSSGMPMNGSSSMPMGEPMGSGSSRTGM